MKYAKEEVLQYVAEEDVKFIRLAFCDVFGKQKNISIMPDELPRAFEHGIAFDASAIAGFGDEIGTEHGVGDAGTCAQAGKEPVLDPQMQPQALPMGGGGDAGAVPAQQGHSEVTTGGFGIGIHSREVGHAVSVGHAARLGQESA